MRTVHVWVSGRVQGVFFRATTAERARELGVRGWVRNLPDGRVEALACGDETAVERFLEFVRTGPPAARVDGVEVEELDAPPADLPGGFDVRRTPA